MYTWKREKQFRLQSLLWYTFAVIELLLATRFLLKLLAFDATSNFQSNLDNITEYLLLPLFGVFNISSTSDSIFDWVTLFAIILYGLLGIGILSFFQARRKEVSQIEIARAYSKKKYGQ